MRLGSLSVSFAVAAWCWCFALATTGAAAFGGSFGPAPSRSRILGRPTSSPSSVAVGRRRISFEETCGLTSAFPGALPIDGESSRSPRCRGSTFSTTRLLAADLGAGGVEPSPEGGEPKLYAQRWVQLAYLSALALLSDWICFSVAASPSTFEEAYPGHSAASLIDMFLFTNVATCFMVTDVVNRFGLKKAIQGASVVMTVGCLLRSGLGFLAPAVSALGMNQAAAAVSDAASTYSSGPEGLVPYSAVVAGTVLVGAAQPFFQCTPPFLSATWFGSDERATSTAVALNFNQIGIATAFLVGGGMATDSAGLASYFGVIAAACIVVTAGTLLQFEDRPPTPPSASEMERSGHVEPPFIDSVKKYFSTPGFTRPLAAFICSISITNIVGAFIDEVMERGGITDQFSIDAAGAGFELAILVGGIIIGGYVDKTKQYKDITLKCILFTMFLLLPLGLTDHRLGNEPLLLVMALLGLGMACGPVQPINAELAVDVTYPGDETAVESVQQIGGNLASALLVPVAEIALEQDYQLLPQFPALASDIRGDVVLLAALAGATYVFFSGFDSPLRRTEADNAAGGSTNGDAIDVAAIGVEAEGLSGNGASNGEILPNGTKEGGSGTSSEENKLLQDMNS